MARTGTGEHPRKLRADAQRNYDAIVAVARKAFDESGAEASLDDIARRAGVGPGTLYRHFPTRSHLHRAVLEDWLEEVRTDGERIKQLALDDPEQALRTWARNHYRHKSYFRGLHARLLDDPDDDETSTLYSCKAVLGDVCNTVLDRAKKAGLVRDDIDPTMVSQMLSGVGMVAERVPDGIDVDAHLDVILAGIRPHT